MNEALPYFDRQRMKDDSWVWKVSTPVGWECPKCHRVWGPQVTECKACRQAEPSLEEADHDAR